MTSPGPRARGENSPERGNFQAVPPPHGGTVPSAFLLSFLPVRWRFLANSLQVASARQSSAPGQSFLSSTHSSPESCVAEVPPS